MGKILAAAFMPHPPLIIPEVGKNDCRQVQKTVDAMKIAAQRLAELKPGTVIVMTPHGVSFQDAATVAVFSELTGSMEKFGVPQCRLDFLVDLPLAEAFLQKAAARGVNMVRLDRAFSEKTGYPAELDSGAFVPLYYLTEAGFQGKIVHICPGLLELEEIAALNVALAEAAAGTENDIVIIGSGDLSHYLKEGPPYGQRPEGAEFDRMAVAAMQDNDRQLLLGLDRTFIARAGECGLRSLLFAMAAGEGAASEFLSYEDTFGVGYAVALWQKNDLSLPLRLARWTLDYWLQKGVSPEQVPDWAAGLAGRHGVFVSLHKQGKLRGCMGTFLPCREDVSHEIMQNALLAAREDPRFPPVRPEELAELTVAVDILSAPEKIPSLDYLDVKKYGVIVSHGHRRGLLLPDLDGVDGVEQQVSIAMQKAGIRPEESIDLYRFTVARHES